MGDDRPTTAKRHASPLERAIARRIASQSAGDSKALWQLAPAAAILGDGLMIVLAAWTLWSRDYMDSFPFCVLMGACLIGGFNIALIVLGRKLPRLILRSLLFVAIVSNVILSIIAGLVGLLGIALLGGGGTSAGLLLFGLPLAASLALNLALMLRAAESTTATAP